jgi:hypothetical protein
MLPASTPCEPGSFNPYRESQKPGQPGVCIFAVFPFHSSAPGWLTTANQQMISRARNGTIEQHIQQCFVKERVDERARRN